MSNVLKSRTTRSFGAWLEDNEWRALLPASSSAEYHDDMKYTVLVREGNETGFVATVPALPGCVSQRKTRRQAIRNAKEAIEVYIEALLEDGLPVPVQTDAELVDVQVSAR